MIRLSKDQILLLHKNLVEKFGGIDGVREEKLFESAISAPFQIFGGQDLYLLAWREIPWRMKIF